MFKLMFYQKNVPIWERWLRVAIGLVAIVPILLGQPPTWLGVTLLVGVIFIVATGFIGFCPMCALVGRKLKASGKVDNHS